jgi:hypothetical protein
VLEPFTQRPLHRPALALSRSEAYCGRLVARSVFNGIQLADEADDPQRPACQDAQREILVASK